MTEEKKLHTLSIRKNKGAIGMLCRDYRVLIDGHDISTAVYSLQINMKAGGAIQASIKLTALDIDLPDDLLAELVAAQIE